MTGLALEGGGSRGSYHIGAMKAFVEAGYRFNGYAGTSIGAINAATFAQGDYHKAAALWSELTTEQLFTADNYKLLKLGESKWDMRMLAEARDGLRSIRDDHGIDTSIITKVLNDNLDEQRIRSGGCDFALVTVSIYERRPYELYLEDIPPGQLLQYISASACVPGFQSVVIGNNTFLDGALYNSCPINMLINKGYDEILAVRTKAPGVFRRVVVPDGVRLRIVVPKHDMGNPMVFSPTKTKENIERGYSDALEILRGS